MTTLLVFIAMGLVLLRQWVLSRRSDSYRLSALARDAGIAIAVLYILIEGSNFWLDVAWWREMGQIGTYWRFLRIRWLPQSAGAVISIIVLMLAFRLGRRRAQASLARTRFFSVLGYGIAALVGALLSINLLDPWVIALYVGARDTGTYQDPMFHKDLTFYLFRLPFYEMVFAWAAGVTIAALVLWAITMAAGSSLGRLDDLRERMAAQLQGQHPQPRRVNPFSPQLPIAGLVRAGGVGLLVIYAVSQFFARYSLLYNQHQFLYGADFVDVRFGLPLLWVQVAGALLLAGAVLMAPKQPPRWYVPGAIGAFLLLAILPGALEGIIRSVYVSPNELTLERPYIADHIRATRMAFNLEQTSREEPFAPRPAEALDLTRFPDTAANIRLWNAEPFRDNVTQLQALRPYYSFPRVDVDRYRVHDASGDQVRQVLIAPRSLDTSLLPSNAQTWINLNLQYTHGYGAVAALVDTATAEGQPELILRDAPPVGPPDFQIQRPELYFDEVSDRPVFVDTGQPEFDYPKGDDNAYTSYHGTAGILLRSPLMRLAAAIQQNDSNVILSSYFNSNTRMLLRRQVLDRIHTLAPFLTYDPDPYLVIGDDGRLYWMEDAFTVSDRHPYAQPITLGDNEINYIRNSVKVTVDAYNGTVRFYVFDDRDPILAAYRRVFPELMRPRSELPATLLKHIRYPLTLFEAQAETYRLYHMQDPQVFYNKEDQWDIARQVTTQEQSSATEPYYMMLRLPGETKSEFVLMLPFTSHSRDNLISWLAARCDPDHYGEIVFYRLPKDQLVYGPLQIQSRVDQDRNISKDLSLWNQQGSRVIRGTTLVLPVDGTFLYVEPIYIQAVQAKLPELKKVVLAIGNRLVYSDTLPEAMAELAQMPQGEEAASAPISATAPAVSSSRQATTTATPGNTQLLQQIQQHLDRYRELTAAGQYAQAGAELQAAQDALRKAIAAGGH